jgi:hypothetical protein
VETVARHPEEILYRRQAQLLQRYDVVIKGEKIKGLYWDHKVVINREVVGPLVWPCQHARYRRDGMSIYTVKPTGPKPYMLLILLCYLLGNV